MVAIITGKGVGLERSSAWVLGSNGQLGAAPQGRAGEEVFVNAATGNLVISRQDEFLIGRGPDVSIDRTYNSQGDLSDDNGDNWRMGVYRKVTGLSGTYGAAGTTVKRIDWDGSDTLYTWNASQSAYVATDGVGAYDKLTRASAVWTWTDGTTQITESYDDANGGRITARTDADGNGLTYTYTGTRITRVTNSNGAYATDDYTDLVYGGTGGNQLLKLETHAGGTLTRVYYTYDAYNRLSVVKVNLNPTDNSDTSGTNYTTTYTYTDTTNKRVASIAQSDGSLIQVSYVLVGSTYKVSALSQRAGWGYDRVTTFTYQTDSTIVTDTLGQKTTLYYDANKNLVRIAHPADGTGTPRTHSFTYTWNGDLFQASLGPNDLMTYSYDAQGNLLTQNDRAGNYVVRTYDSKNHMLTERRYVAPYTSTGETGTPMTTRYAYDSLGHLRYVVTPEGFVTEYKYETNPANLGHGQRIATIDYAANAYNVSGLAYNATISESALNTWVAGIGDKSTTHRTQFEYDYRGNLAAEKSYSRLLSTGLFDTSSELSQTTYVYDQAGNLLSKLVNGSSATETFLYDGLNRIVSSTDFNNVTTTVAFNDAARTTIVSLANGLVQTSLFGYAGELLTYSEAGTGISAGNSFIYDALGRLVVKFDALWQPEIFFYDALGQKVASVDSDGSVTEYRYDTRGDLSSTTAYATRLSAEMVAYLADDPTAYPLIEIIPLASADDRWTWNVYDDAHRLVQTIDGTGATTIYAYDAASRLVSTKQYATPLSASVLADLKAAAVPQNILLIEDEEDWGWSAPGLTVASAGWIDGYAAYKFTGNGSYDAIDTIEDIPAYTGDILTMSVSMLAVGTNTTHDFGIWTDWEAPYEWGFPIDVTILSGPGTLTKLSGGQYRISGLSTTEATRIAMVRTFDSNLVIRPRFWLAEWNAQQMQHYTGGLSIILAGPVMTRTQVGVTYVPATDAAKDRVSRNFYDRDDRLIGTLDAEGYLTQIVYDKAGLKTKTIAYSGATGATYRASGTFAQLLGSVTVDNAKDIHNYFVYDARGMLRATVDGEGGLTRYAYTPLGDVSEVVTGQKLDPATLLTTPPTLANLPSAPSGTVLETTAYTRNHYGQPLTEAKSLTGGTSTVTAYVYDSMRRLVSTTTQSGGPDARIESRRYDLRGRVQRELSGIGSALLAALGPNPDEELSEPIWTEYGTLYGYDDADRLIARVDANGARTLYYYDADDRLAYQVGALGEVVEYRYDAFGARTDTIVYAARIDIETFVEMTGGAAADVAGIVAALANPLLDQRSTALFDLAGRTRASRDPLGNVTLYAYNSFGEIVSETAPLESGIAAPAIVTPDFSFEAPETGTGATYNPTVSGVTFASKSGVVGNGSSWGFAAAPDGDQVAFVQSNSTGTGAITMTVTGLNAGTVYQLSFMVAKRASVAANPLLVTVDGQVLGYLTPSSTSFTQVNLGPFQATSGSATITFSGTQSSSEKMSAIDKVIVTQAPIVPHTSFETPEVNSGSQYNPSIGMATFESKAGVAGNGSSWGFAAAPDGDQVAFLQSNSGGTGSISEKLTNLIPGRSYQLSFYLAKRSSANANPVTVSVDGVVLGTFTPGSTSFAQFTAQAFQATGTTATLTFSGAASATEKVSALDKLALVQLASNNLLTTYSYDRRGQLKTQIVDAAAGGKAITTTYGYDAFGRPVQLTDPAGQATAAAFDRAGRIASVTDALDGVRSFTYDARGNLVAATDAMNRVTRYVYDNAGRRIFAVDALGGVVETSYDGDGRVLATRAYANAIFVSGLELAAADVTAQLVADSGDRITRNAYDKNGRLRFTVDGTLGLTEYGYDDAGNRVRTIRHAWSVQSSTCTMDDLQAEVDAHAADPRRVSRAVYDGAGRITFTIDPVGNVVVFSYDSAGRVTKQVAFVTAYQGGDDPLDDAMQSWAAGNADAGDRVSRAVYDRKGRLVYSIDAEGFVTEYRYDKRDSVVKEIRYADPYTVADGATPASLAAQIGTLPWSAIVTDFVYDSAGRLSETVDGLGVRTVMTLDQRGQILSSTTAYGTGDAVTTTFVYDELGRTLSETHAAGSAEEQTTTYVYDVLGELVSTTHAAGTAAEWITTQSHDALGRLKREMSGIGSALLAALGPNPDAELADPIWAEYAIQYGYDTAGRLVARSDERGGRTLYYYDAADRLAFEVDALGDVVEHRYNALGDCIEIIRYAARIDGQTFSEMVGGDVADIAGIVAALADASLDQAGHFEFNLDGTIQRSTDPLGAQTTYVYNSFGEIALRSDPFNAGTTIQTSFDYDRRGHLTTQIVDAAAGGKAITTTYGHDAFGRPFLLIDPDDQYTITSYDQNDRVVATIDAWDNSTYFTYDARGNLVAVEDPMGQVTRFVYDHADRRIFAVDALGGVVETSYDEAGRAVATRAYATAIPVYGLSYEIAAADVTEQLIADAGDRITRNAYDKDGRLRFTVDGAAGLTEYRYDDAGHPVRSIRYGWTVSSSTYTLDDLQAEVDAHAADPQRASRATYDAAGRVTFAIDPAGNVTAFSYDSAGRVIKKVAFVTAYQGGDDPLDDAMQSWAAGNADAGDRVSRAVYDRKGRPVYSIDAEGFVTEYRYDKRDSVVKEIRYADPYTVADGAALATMAALLPSSVPASAIVTDFVYDSAGRLAETVDGLGHRTVMTLDQRGQILSSTTAYGTGDAVTASFEYDALGRIESETRAAGTAEEQTTIYVHNALGELVSITHAAGTAAEWTTTRSYDALGRLKREMSGIGSALLAALGPWPDPELADPIWAEYATQFGYDTAGRMVARSDAKGARTLFYYDTTGRLAYEVDAKGHVVEYRYNPLGDRTDTIRYAARIDDQTFSEMAGGDVADIAGIVAALADAALDEKKTASFDSAGRMILNTGQLGAYAAYSYNSFGEVELRRVALGVATEIATSYIYDRRGLLETEIVDSAAGGKAITTGHGYDALGQEISLTDPNNRITATAYDEAGRIVSTTNALEETTFYTYDARGNLVAVKDALNHVTRFVYDHADRRIFAVDALGGVVATSYDEADRAVATRAYATAISLSGFGLQISAADVAGRLAADSDDRITRNAYDKDGRLRFTVDGAAGLTEYRYDDVGQPVRIVRYGWTVSSSTYTMDDLQAEVDAHAADPQRVSRAVYDAAGRMTFAIDATAKVTAFAYDAAGRVIKQIVFATAYEGGEEPLDDAMQSWAAGSGDADDRVSRAVYDREGRLVYSVDAESYVTEYRHDRLGQVTQDIRYKDAYAIEDGATPASVAALLPASIPLDAVTNEYFYDSAGRLEKTRDSLGTWTVMTLDQRGQTIAKTVADGTADAATTGFGYDALGRIESETRAVGAAGESTTVYDYDPAGNLVAITYAAGTVDQCVTTRTYDAAGRLESETRAVGADEEVETGFGYNAFGDLERTTTAQGTIDEQVTTRIYDELGRLESETSADGTPEEATTAYAYDVFGNVARVTDPLLNNAYFYYDALDRLILQVDPEGYATKTVYETGAEPMSVTRYATPTQGASLAGPPSITLDPEEDATTVFQRDKLDRLTGIVDAEEFTESYELDAFGDRISVTNKLLGTTYNVYDERGLLLQETLPINAVDEDGTELATTIVNKFEYDLRGNRKKMIEAFGLPEARTTLYFYDKQDRPIEQRGEALSVTTTALATTTITPSQFYSYDRRGNLIETVDANGAHVWSFYDHLNRKTGQVDALGTLTTWTYDGNGNASSSRVYATAVALPAAGARTAPDPGASAYRETLYFYDGNNRLIRTKILQLRVGEYGATYATSLADVVTENFYDAAGNLVRQKDGRGNSVFTFYDKLGRRIAQVDEGNYLTSYTLDGDGNVLKEERFATQISGTVTTTSSPAALRAGVLNGANAALNRVTEFLYDRNGRRTDETRLNVDAKALDVNGALEAAAFAYARIHYEYNGLGQVTLKTEANGDFVEYEYDAMGRETSVMSAPYTDFEEDPVRNTVDTFYNGLNLVTRSIERSKSGTADRVTSSIYGTGGRLSSTTDAAGFTRHYGYDAAGQVVMERYDRLQSDGTFADDAIAYRYDLAGRLVFQSTATFAGGVWTFGDATQMRYNAFGEVTGRGVNVANDAWQETFEYDSGGRMWRSTSGDGAARIYLYDANGKATLTIASAGTADLLTYAQGNSADSIGETGGTNIDGAVTTVTVRDRRGQDIATIAPSREIEDDIFTTITTSRLYNAFGEVIQETDARGNTTLFGYNTMGRLVKSELPLTSWTDEHGEVFQNVRPTENYSYDLSGRMIGVQDANGFTITRRLLVGTGYGESEAVVLAEYHPDTGVARRAVDEFGDIRRATDEIDRVTGYSYDAMGRVTEEVHAGNTLTDSYRYDGLGQRIEHWNSYYGPTVIDRTDYDADGRVVKVIRAYDAADSETVKYDYAWNGSLATGDLGTFGAWVQTTTYLDRTSNHIASETKDYFGHMLAKSDLGQRTTSFDYDEAGQLTAQTSSAGQNLSFTYFNTGKIATITDGYADPTYSAASVQSTFGYDEAGQRVFEGYVKTSYVYDYYTGYSTPETKTLQWARVTYDEVGRMKSFEDTGATGSNPVSINWEYDRVGNVRLVDTTYTPVTNGLPPPDPLPRTQRWYTYDAMNRMVHVMGYLAGERGSGEITNDISTVGSGYAFYDAAGQRASFTSNYFIFEGAGAGFGLTLEAYTYDDQGYLEDVTQSSAPKDILTGEVGAWSSPVLIGSDTRDALGRLIAHSEYKDGNSVYSMSAVYNALSQKTSESTSTRQYDNSLLTTSVTYDYRAETFAGSGVWTGEYQGGAVTHVQTISAVNGSPQPVANLTNSYDWWDDARLSVVTNKPSTTTTYTSTYSYDENGKVASVVIQDGRARTVNYVTDIYGQVMSRKEYSQATYNPETIYYYFNGLRVGDIGNDGPGQVDYATAINQRGGPPQTTPFKNDQSISYADFDQAYDPISPGSEPDAPGGYIARDGDTLQSIARAIWGDAAMWYLLAEANGLSASAVLVAGQMIRIPPKVTNIHNNSETFRVYDPNEALGDTSPTQAGPPQAASTRRNRGCGILGTIILIAIAVAITIILKVPVTNLIAFGSTAATTVAVPAAAAIAGAAVTGAIASVVSQGIGVITGIQEKFSWKGVAMSALSAGITQGVGGGQLINGAGKFVNDVARGALTNAVTQGVAVVTGLQKKFDWAGIAVAGVVSGVTGAISRSLPGAAQPAAGGNPATPASHGNTFASGLAGAIAGAGVRSIVTGTSFGDNILAVLPDVIGSTIGNMIGTSIAERLYRPPEAPPPGNTDYDGDGAPGIFEEQDSYLAQIANRPYNILTDGFRLDPIRIELSPELEAMLALYGNGGLLVGPAPADPDDGSIVVTGVRWSKMSPEEQAAYMAAKAERQAQFEARIQAQNRAFDAAIPPDRTYAKELLPLSPNGYGGITQAFLSLNARNPVGSYDWLEQHLADPAWTFGAAVDNFARSAGIEDFARVAAAARAGVESDPRRVLSAQFAGIMQAEGERRQAEMILRQVAQVQQISTAIVMDAMQRSMAEANISGFERFRRGVDSFINWANDGITSMVSSWDRASDRTSDPRARVLDFGVHAFATILRGGTGLIQTVNRPREALFHIAGRIDSVLMDDRPAWQVARESYRRVSNMSTAEIFRGGGDIAGHIALLAAPVKFAPRLRFVAEGNLGVRAAMAQRLALPETLVDAADFIGPRIGRSGFRTTAELAEAVGTRYQRAVDDAFPAANLAESRGLLEGNRNTRIGDYVDRASAREIRQWLAYEGIAEGPTSLVQMNRWLRDPSGSGLYVRPDIRIPGAGRIFDATVGFKPYNSPQIVRFGQFSGGDYITIVRPRPIGSYSIVP
jgi:YD repeat-containing protein